MIYRNPSKPCGRQPCAEGRMGSYTHDQKQWLKFFEHRNSQAKFPAVRITQVLQAGISLRTEAGVWCSSCTCWSSQVRAYRGVGTWLMILSTAGRAENRRSAGRNRCFWLSGVFYLETGEGENTITYILISKAVGSMVSITARTKQQHGVCLQVNELTCPACRVSGPLAFSSSQNDEEAGLLRGLDCLFRVSPGR